MAQAGSEENSDNLTFKKLDMITSAKHVARKFKEIQSKPLDF